ncbi:MAG TPA: hypothetical protein VHG31_08010, partial [Stellaceae bacterium]|nr:hypothetical protein [Stellaceae bacterium]
VRPAAKDLYGEDPEIRTARTGERGGVSVAADARCRSRRRPLSCRERASPFRIDSFFDVFVELSLGTSIPLTTKREITAEAVQAVPEASSLAAIAMALPMMLAIYRRRGVASPATRTT